MEKLCLQNQYTIYDDGRLFSNRRHKFLRPAIDKYGYLCYTVSISRIRMTVKAHRLVAQAFIPNPENKPTVNHVNCDRSDNRVCNLEWATILEQHHHAPTREKMLKVYANTDYYSKGLIRNFGRRSTKVYKEGQLLGVFPSLLLASMTFSVSMAKASEVANGKRKTTKGLVFVYE